MPFQNATHKFKKMQNDYKNEKQGEFMTTGRGGVCAIVFMEWLVIIDTL